ncbi:MAG: VOC family protein [Winogradskyella sp.]|uniref:VOC family protein n=1 Tax=Winogradskyella sp. TaxID=1883156 RepID=UPI0017B07ACA|nr:VOC family protein [Winogradskyella sp.]
MNLNQVTIPALDVEKSVNFYITLGLQLIVDALPNYARLLCPVGDSTFSIRKVEVLSKDEGVTLYFEVNNLSKTVKELQEKGVIFNTSITEQPWLWTEARLNDPDGNNLILFNAGKNRKNPPWRIN